MRPPNKEEYSPPQVTEFASREALLAHFAKGGDPGKFAKVQQFLRDIERAKPAKPVKLAAKR